MVTNKFCLTIIVFFSFACFFISCNQGNSEKTDTEKIPAKKISGNKENTDTGRVYSFPDYNDLRYKEIPWDTTAQTVLLNYNSLENVTMARKRMNTVIDSIHILYADSTSFLIRLDKTQKAWIKYFNAMFELWYPETEMGYSVEGLCENSYRQELIDKRIRELNLWLMGSPSDGDACNGNIRLLDYSYHDVIETEKRDKKK